MNVTTQGIGHKVMSVLMALVLAIGLAPMVPAGNAWAATDEAMFKAATPTWTIEGSEIEYTGQPAAVGVESIVSDELGAYNESDYTVCYFKDTDNDGKLSDGDERVVTDESKYGAVAPVAVGKYFIVAVYGNGMDYITDDNPMNETFLEKAGYLCKFFEITERSLEGVKAVNVENSVDGSFTEGFTYNAEAQEIGFALGDDLLTEGEDYSVTVVDKKTGEAIDPANIVNAGEYEATLIGMGGFQNDEQKVTITVNALNLDNAEIYTPDYLQGKQGDETTIDGVGYSKLANDIVPAQQTKYQAVDGNVYAANDGAEGGFVAWSSTPAVGGYWFSLSAKPGSTNVVGGPVEYKINVVETLVTDFRYGDVAQGTLGSIAGLDAMTGEDAFNLSEGEAFDPAAVKAYKADGTAYKADEATVVVTPESADAAGHYTAVARIETPANYSIGGSATCEFDVIAGKVNGEVTDIIVILDGKNVEPGATGATTTYDAEAVVPTVTVKCGDKILAAGTDYTVEYTDEADKVVDQIVNAGAYKLTVKSDTYVVSNGEFNITVNPAEITSAYIDNMYGKKNILPYTGEEIEPVYVGVAKDGSEFDLTEDDYSAALTSGGSSVNAVKDVAAYKAVLTLKGNFTGTATVGFQVLKTILFDDVAASEWYGPYVLDAFSSHYMKGMSDGIFAPAEPMTRAQFAQVVFNMAGGVQKDFGATYPTPFEDVASDAWYAQAVAWAAEAGIVKGTSDTTFDPEGKISREQIATMLYRYAEVAGMDTTVEDAEAALAAFVDGDQVSDWAAAAMAWAVESGYMNGKGANDLQPQATATRAEIAALSVRVQPETLTEPIA